MTVETGQPGAEVAACRRALAAGRFADALAEGFAVCANGWQAASAENVLAVECIAAACRGLGQRFFGAMLDRHASFLRAQIAPVERYPELEASAGDLRQADEDARDFVRSLCAGWHRLGVPVLPILDPLDLGGGRLGSSCIASLSWWLPLPLGIPKIGRPTAMVTAFDFGERADARDAFRSEVEALSRTPDSPMPLIAANGTARIGVFSLLRFDLVEPVLTAGARVLENGLPGAQAPFALADDTPPAWTRMGDQMAAMSAPLLAMAAFERAASGYLATDDLLSHLLARVRRAAAWAAAGNAPGAQAALAEIVTDAKDARIPEVVHYIETELKTIQAGPDEAPTGPFVFDPDTGKVIGGAQLADVEHEFRAAQLLCEAWETEFPGEESPFADAYAVTTFEWTMPVLGRPGETKRLVLGQLARQSCGRRFVQDDLVAQANGAPQAYIERLATTLFCALWLMHVRLQGSFTSPTGSCLSPGNLTAHPKIVDYETACAPALGGGAVSRDLQRADAIHAFALVLLACERLGQRDGQAKVVACGFDAYPAPWRGPRDRFVARTQRLAMQPAPEAKLVIVRSLAEVLVPGDEGGDAAPAGSIDATDAGLRRS